MKAQAQPGAAKPESRMNRRSFVLSCAFGLGAVVSPAPAQAEEKTPAEKARERWQKLSPEKREKLRERYQRFQELPPKEQARVRKNLERWQKLTPEQKKATRGRYQQWRELPPEKRDELRQRWQDLTPEQRKELRKRRGGRRPGKGS